MTICGLDIHKSSVWVHILDEMGNTVFDTDIARNPDDLEDLKQLIQQLQVDKAIMVSTNTYWIPVYMSLKELVSHHQSLMRTN